MTSTSNLLRSLIVYGAVVPVALILGYMLATPLDYSTITTLGVVLLVLCVPLILRWHFEMLFFFWNVSIVAIFVPGGLPLWIVMAFLSLLISVIQRTLVSRMRFLPTGPVLLPLLCLAAVVAGTAYLTGGIGLRIFGSGNIGGKRYLWIFAGIVAFLAMTVHAIPASKSHRFFGFYFLSQLLNVVGTFGPYLPSAFYFIFLLFPYEGTLAAQTELGAPGEAIARLGGVSTAGLAVCYYLWGRYGIRWMFEMRNISRLALFIAAFIAVTLGGFRSNLIMLTLVFSILYWLEGLLHSRYTVRLVFALMLLGAMLVPFANKLPLNIQRTLSILPLDISMAARMDAEASKEWRLGMWKIVLPEVPQHLLLGKGLGMSAKEFEKTWTIRQSGEVAAMAILAGDYHNGPLSVVMPFGIWGAITFLWFLVASTRVMYRNYQFGRPDLRTINALLFAMFATKVFIFFFVFGSFNTDLAVFCGIVGFSIALNGGICKPDSQSSTTNAVAAKFQKVAPQLAGVAPSRGK